MGAAEVAKRVGRPLKRLFERVIDNRIADFHMPPDMPGDLLLTFDDGPHPEHTPAVLDLLEQAGARAVFFVIGERARRRPDLLRACVERGHLLANHTETHLNDAIGGHYARQRVVEEIRQCDAVVAEATGRRTFLFRPPRGEMNLKTLGAVRETGHRMVMWSAEGGEWGRRSHLSAEGIAAHVEGTVRRRDVVLMHDDNPKTAVVMARALPAWRARGYDLSSAVVHLLARQGQA